MLYFANFRQITPRVEECAMNKKIFLPACLLALIALILNFQFAFAHESITVGDYEIVYGWVNEPAIVGQLNGVEIFVTNTSAGDEQPLEGHIIHSLNVELSYGGEKKVLSLEPIGEDPTSEFAATIIPTIPGVYTLKFSGRLGDTAVDTEAELEPVQQADMVQFPSAESTDSGTADWLVWLSLLLGLLGVGLGAIALRKAR
jgi:hypothetical protein